VDPVEFPDPVPQPLPLGRVLAQKLRAEHPLDEVVEHDGRPGTGEERDAFHAFVRPDPQYRTVTGRRAAGQTVAPPERRVGGGYVHPEGFDMCDLHEPLPG
jgi:hypothetical protein